METEEKERGAKGTGGRATGAKEMGGRRGGWRRERRELSHDTTAGQISTEGVLCKSYSGVVIEGMRRSEGVYGLIVRTTDRRISTGSMWWFTLHGKNRGY